MITNELRFATFKAKTRIPDMELVTEVAFGTRPKTACFLEVANLRSCQNWPQKLLTPATEVANAELIYEVANRIC